MAAITVYDGAGCIGGNKIYLGYQGERGRQGVFFDFGLNYGKLGDYYQEFLQPRPARGIHDHMRMGLIPFIRNYRPDIVPRDLDLSAAPELEVAAVLVSHAHMDHMGHMALLGCEIPCVCSPMTAGIMRAMRDCGAGGFEAEVAYTNLKTAQGRDGRVLSVPGGCRTYQGRDFVLTEDWSAELEGFWGKCCARSKCVEGSDLLPKDSVDVDFEAFPVDHSIYGATAFAVRTEKGPVIYTGDLRLHGKSGASTERFVDRAAGLDPRALIIEGTTTVREASGDCTEESVKQTCLEAAEGEDDLIVADFSARHFERLESFKEIAARIGRTLLVMPKDAFYLKALKYVDGEDRLRGLGIYHPLKSKPDGPESWVAEKMAGALVDPREVASSPDQYVLAFSFYDMGNLLDIRPERGTYIYSSSEAYSEEQVIDFQRLHQWVLKFGLEVRGFSMESEEGGMIPVFDRRFHASGHASVDQLLEIVEGVGAEIVIPVHTQDPAPFRSARASEVVVPVAGERIEL